MPVRLTVEIGLVETVKGERENRKWTPKESWINPLGQRRWAKPPDLSKAILLELSKKLLFKTTLHFCASGCAARYCAVREACCTASANARTRKKFAPNENLAIRKSCSARKKAMHGCAVRPYACFTRASGLADSKWDDKEAAVFSVHSSLPLLG